MPAKELTEVNCHPRHSCSKLLVIDAIFIWFSDRMLFTLTTLKKIGEWRLVQQRLKSWSKNAFSHKNGIQSVATGDRPYLRP